MFCNFLTSDRRQTVKRLEELAGKRAEYTRVPHMAFIVEGIAVERDGTVTTEEGASMELIDKLIAEELIQVGAPEATAETAEAAEGEELSEADEAPAETEIADEREELAEGEAEEAADTTEAEEPSEADEESTETDEREELAEGEDATEDEPSASDEPPETEEASEIEGVQAMEIEGVQAMEIEGPEEEAPTATCYEDLIEHEPEPPEAIKPSISFPLAAHRAESIVNLVCSIYSRGNLLSKATGGVFNASEELVDSFQMVSDRAGKEEVLRIIRNEGGISSVSFTKDKVVFDGFPETTDAIRSWTVLSAAINKNAIKQIHVRAKEVDETNEKFAFRTWLTRLGMNGEDLRAERNLLYRNLSGHTAFRTEKDEEKWKRKQSAKRAELKALKAAANTESGEGAAETHSHIHTLGYDKGKDTISDKGELTMLKKGTGETAYTAVFKELRQRTQGNLEQYIVMNIPQTERKVILRKVRTGSYDSVKDAKFQIYTYNRAQVASGTDDAGNPITTFTSAENGVYFIDKLPFGTYYLHETATVDKWFRLTAGNDTVTGSRDGMKIEEISVPW